MRSDGGDDKVEGCDVALAGGTEQQSALDDPQGPIFFPIGPGDH